jgi:hypothetical protein
MDSPNTQQHQQQHVNNGSADKPLSLLTDPCPLSLQSFPALDVGECCPLFVRSIKEDESIASSSKPPAKEDLNSLQRELELLVQSATYRIKKLTEEYQKADQYVKANRDPGGPPSGSVKSSESTSGAQTTATVGATSQVQSTIKLDLKKLKAEGLLGSGGGDESNNASSTAAPITKQKKRRKDG